MKWVLIKNWFSTFIYLNWYSLYMHCDGWVCACQFQENPGSSSWTYFHAIALFLSRENLDCLATNKYAFIYGRGNQMIMVKIGTVWSSYHIVFILNLTIYYTKKCFYPLINAHFSQIAVTFPLPISQMVLTS